MGKQKLTLFLFYSKVEGIHGEGVNFWVDFTSPEKAQIVLNFAGRAHVWLRDLKLDFNLYEMSHSNAII